MIDVKGFARDNNEFHEKTINRRKNAIMVAFASEFPRNTSLYDVLKYFGFGTYQTTLVAVHYLVEEELLIGMSPYDKEAPDDLTKHFLLSKPVEDKCSL